MSKVKFNPKILYPKIKGTKSNPLKGKDILVRETLVGVKADAYEKGLDDHLINMLKHTTGIKIVAKKVEVPAVAKVRNHYSEHVHKKFYPELESYITRGNFGLYVFKGENAVKKVRQACMQLRARYAPGAKTENLLHSSDGVFSAQKEIRNWFQTPPYPYVRKQK